MKGRSSACHCIAFMAPGVVDPFNARVPFCSSLVVNLWSHHNSLGSVSVVERGTRLVYHIFLFRPKLRLSESNLPWILVWYYNNKGCANYGKWRRGWMGSLASIGICFHLGMLVPGSVSWALSYGISSVLYVKSPAWWALLDILAESLSSAVNFVKEVQIMLFHILQWKYSSTRYRCLSGL